MPLRGHCRPEVTSAQAAAAPSCFPQTVVSPSWRLEWTQDAGWEASNGLVPSGGQGACLLPQTLGCGSVRSPRPVSRPALGCGAFPFKGFSGRVKWTRDSLREPLCKKTERSG